MARLTAFGCLLSGLVAAASAQSLNGYVPACSTKCLSDTISASTTCAPNDNACICNMVYTLKRNSEFCLQDNCDKTQYGQVMTGIDSFCRAVGSGTSPSISILPPPTGTTISDPSYSGLPPASPSGAPTTSISPSATVSPSTIVVPSTTTTGSESPSATVLPPTTATTSTQSTVGTTSLTTSTTLSKPGNASTPSPTSTPTPTQSPIAAGVQQRAGYAAVAGGFLAAVFFSL